VKEKEREERKKRKNKRVKKIRHTKGWGNKAKRDAWSEYRSTAGRTSRKNGYLGPKNFVKKLAT
jgi:hypothetical protein